MTCPAALTLPVLIAHATAGAVEHAVAHGSAHAVAHALAPPALSLAYRPFLDPIDAHSWWLLLCVPLVLFISMAYKAMRVPTMRYYWRQVIKMTLEILAAIILLSIALFLIVEFAMPRM